VTDPVQPRPQPVIEAGQLAGNVLGVLTGFAGIFATVGVVTHWAWALGAAAALTAAAAGLSKFMPAITAAGAAAQVTPLSDPRDHQLRPLTRSGGGKHRAPEGDVESQVHHGLDYIREHYSRTDTQEIPRVTDQPVHRIPEQVVPGKRLGRHVRHDPRSLSYLVPETTTPTTAMWTRRVPVFDQGDTGSCTGNAAAGVLGTDPFYSTLPAGLVDDEGEAVKLYSSATGIDDYPGTYPPDDTGSDGLSVAKACQKAGLISGYQHITSVAAAQTAIKSGPFIVGCNWYTSMDNPNSGGLVTVSGSIRGGHEFECHGYDAEYDRWWFTNSWGTSWGKDGTFCMSSASFARLLSEQGDATVFLPIAAPFPPEPPAPTPPSPPQPALPPASVAALMARILHRKGSPKEDVAAANDYDEWLAAQ